MDASHLKKYLKRIQSHKIIAFTNGAFNLLDDEHISILRYAKTISDYVIVGVNSDESVRNNGIELVNNQDVRLSDINELKCVDFSFIFCGNVSLYIDLIMPSVYFRIPAEKPFQSFGKTKHTNFIVTENLKSFHILRKFL